MSRGPICCEGGLWQQAGRHDLTFDERVEWLETTAGKLVEQGGLQSCPRTSRSGNAVTTALFTGQQSSSSAGRKTAEVSLCCTSSSLCSAQIDAQAIPSQTRLTDTSAAIIR
jgi:hypothetical protein